MRARIRVASPGLVGGEKPVLPENSHAIPVDQSCMCLKNVGIATVGVQSLNNAEGNCMRHLWGTMRVSQALAGRSQALAGRSQALAGRSQGSPGTPRAVGSRAPSQGTPTPAASPSIRGW